MLFLIALTSAQALSCPVDILFHNESIAACMSIASISEKFMATKALSGDYYRATGMSCEWKYQTGVWCKGIKPCKTMASSVFNRVLLLYTTRECANTASVLNNSIHVGAQMYLPLYSVCQLHPQLAGKLGCSGRLGCLECHGYPGGEDNNIASKIAVA